MRFGTRLIVLFSGLFIVSSGIAVLFVYASNTKALERQIRDTYEVQAFDTMDKIDRLLHERAADVKILAADPVLRSHTATPAQIARKLAAFRDTYPDYAALSFLGLDRVTIAGTAGMGIGARQPLEGYWREIADGKESAVAIGQSASQNEPVLHFARIVRDDHGTPLGVVVATMPLDRLYDMIWQSFTLPEREHKLTIELADEHGLILYSNSRREAVLHQVLPDWGIVAGLLARGRSPGSSVEKHVRDDGTSGEEIVVFAQERGYGEYAGKGWTLVIDVPTEVAFAPANSLISRLSIFFAACGVVILCCIFLLSRRISSPVRTLAAAAIEIGKGNLDVAMPAPSRDEMGQLSAAFNTMAAELKTTRDQLLYYNCELERTVTARTAELLSTTERLSLLLESLPIIVYMLAAGGDRRATYVSGNVQGITGYRPEEFTADAAFWRERIHPDDRPQVLNDLSRLFEQGHHEHEYRWRLANGTYAWFYDVMRLSADKDDAGHQIVGVWMDIEARKQMEEELRRARDAAEAASRAKTEFITNINHELRTPLTAVIGFSEVLQRQLVGALNAKQSEYVGHIISSSKRLLDILTNILDMSAVIFNQMELQASRFRVKDFISSSIAIFREDAEKRGIQLEWTLAADADVDVEADLVKLRKIISHLLSNALKFTAAGGDVHIHAEVRPDPAPAPGAQQRDGAATLLAISVADTGCGIKDEDMAKLFVLFSQIEDPMTKGFSGTGVGLALCRKLAMLHGGDIRVSSELGKGSRFTCIVPLHQSNAAAEEDQSKLSE